MSATTCQTTWHYNSKNYGLHFTNRQKLNRNVRFYIFTAVNKKITVFLSVFTCSLKTAICETIQHDIPEGHNLQTVTFCFCNMLKRLLVFILVPDEYLMWRGSLECTELHFHIHYMTSYHGTYKAVLYVCATHFQCNIQKIRYIQWYLG